MNHPVDADEIATPDVDDFDLDAEYDEPDNMTDANGVEWQWVTGSVGGGENFQTYGFWQRVDEADADRPEGTLGSCGCIDYHYADCPTRTG